MKGKYNNQKINQLYHLQFHRDDGMTATASVDIEILNTNAIPCRIDNLNEFGNDFQKGEVDKFEVIITSQTKSS